MGERKLDAAKPAWQNWRRWRNQNTVCMFYNYMFIFTAIRLSLKIYTLFYLDLTLQEWDDLYLIFKLNFAMQFLSVRYTNKAALGGILVKVFAAVFSRS